jgi:plasmid stability protein
MIQVRNVPDALHRSLKARAAMAGMSLSDYLLGELREIAERPTLAEFRDRLHKRKPLPVALDTGGLLREERTERCLLWQHVMIPWSSIVRPPQVMSQSSLVLPPLM